MLELEIKVLEIDRPMVESLLGDCGAEKIFDGEILDFKYDNVNRDVKNSSKSIRLRRKGDLTYLTIKEKIFTNCVRARTEFEIQIPSFEDAERYLSDHGLFSLDLRRKHRTSYILDGILYEFDKLNGEFDFVPEYLEIEGPSVASIYMAALGLGFMKDDERISNLSVGGLIRKYRDEIAA
jgi:predicted adenylyl cyclase CyaB